MNLEKLIATRESISEPNPTYVGTYTREEGEGIYAIQSRQKDSFYARLVQQTQDASFLVQHPSKSIIYAANECLNGMISAFEYQKDTGDLKDMGTVSTLGASPCHLAVHPSGEWLAVANYRGGTTVVIALESNGKLDKISDQISFPGRGLNATRQTQSHPHGVYWSEKEDELWMTDLGTDRVYSLKFNPNTGKFAGLKTSIEFSPGCGPRHLVLHSNGSIIYCLAELTSRVFTLVKENGGDSWRIIGDASTLPHEYNGENLAAEIALHPKGDRLYVSNRGHDSISVFDIAANKENPKCVEYISAEGKSPRHFAVTSEHLIIANQKSNSVVIFGLNEAGGMSKKILTIPIAEPACVLVIKDKF